MRRKAIYADREGERERTAALCVCTGMLQPRTCSYPTQMTMKDGERERNRDRERKGI